MKTGFFFVYAYKKLQADLMVFFFLFLIFCIASLLKQLQNDECQFCIFKIILNFDIFV